MDHGLFIHPGLTLSIWVSYNDLTPTSLEWWLGFGELCQEDALSCFRLVKYYNLPMYLYDFICIYRTLYNHGLWYLHHLYLCFMIHKQQLFWGEPRAYLELTNSQVSPDVPLCLLAAGGRTHGFGVAPFRETSTHAHTHTYYIYIYININQEFTKIMVSE